MHIYCWFNNTFDNLSNLIGKEQYKIKIDDICLYFKEDIVYELIEKVFWETKYKSSFDYCCDRHQVTDKTIQLNLAEDNIGKAMKTATFIMNFVNQEKKLSYILNPFQITSKIGLLKSFIKYFYIFDDDRGYNMLFVTNDDKVFGFGSNYYGCCGLGHSNSVSDPQLIKQLCDKNVTKFFNGLDFAFALTNDNLLYAWGRISDERYNFYKPTILIEFNCSINQICCSEYFSLILTEERKVYAWGDNRDSRIARGKAVFLHKPEKLEEFSSVNVKLITCNLKTYCILSEENFNLRGTIISKKTIGYPFETFTFFLTSSNYLYALTMNKELLYLNSNLGSDLIFRKIDCSDCIISIDFVKSWTIKTRDRGLIIVITEDRIYYVNTTNQELVPTSYTNAYDFCAEELQVTYKTIDLELQKEIKTKSLKITGMEFKSRI